MRVLRTLVFSSLLAASAAGGCFFEAAQPPGVIEEGGSPEGTTSAGGGEASGPSCSDGIQNGDEIGLDCGGPDCPACAPAVACSEDDQCATGSCVDGFCCDTPCNGTCEACGAYACGPTGCLSTCLVDADCSPAYMCTSEAACKKRNGQTCGAASECASTHCVDGVCCNSACDGTCMACNVPTSLGTCSAAPAGTDLHNDCSWQASSTCGNTGTCDGNGACAMYPDGTVCAATYCMAGVVHPASTCNGNGSCEAASTISCNGFTCDSSGTGCETTCNQSTPCMSTHFCSSGQCIEKYDAGHQCTYDAQCQSGNCAFSNNNLICQPAP